MRHQRIIIIGCGGSGKSTFARELGKATGIPVVHLDKLYWKPGWQHLTKDEFDQIVRAEIAKDQWIMDGNFNRTIPMRLERCDAVIYLDLPRLICMMGVLKRVISTHGRTRADMGEGCPERFDLSFLKWVWNFNRDHREKYLSLLNGCGKAVYRIRSRRELPGLLESFRKS